MTRFKKKLCLGFSFEMAVSNLFFRASHKPIFISHFSFFNTQELRPWLIHWISKKNIFLKIFINGSSFYTSLGSTLITWFTSPWSSSLSRRNVERWPRENLVCVIIDTKSYIFLSVSSIILKVSIVDRSYLPIKL